jgi:hypothetical protein
MAVADNESEFAAAVAGAVDTPKLLTSSTSTKTRHYKLGHELQSEYEQRKPQNYRRADPRQH